MSRLGNFPLGTLAVNLAGSFLISLVMAWGAGRGGLADGPRLFLVTGVLGGFTTYSSFNFETLRLVQSGAPGLAVLNLGLTLAGCFVAGIAGFALAR
jgi:CrcB protein